MRTRLILLLWLLALTCARAELMVGKPEWGFDGTALAEAFNLLTFEVRNTGGQAFEGELVLDDGSRFGGRSAAPYVQKVFLAPGTVKNVQFYPYYTSSVGDLRLSWKEHGGGEIPIDSPSPGAPAIVMLADFDAPNLRALRMPAFDEAKFPPTAAVTDALHAVVLDHQPRWDPARREAFLEWLKRGGLVHLIHGPDGAIPQFSGELEALNISGAQGHVGAGLVVKHAVARTDITPDFLRAAGFAAPERQKGMQYRHDTGDYGVFRQLSLVTKPNIAWGLIYTLTLAYVGLIGPAFYFLRKRDYRFLLAGFIGTVAIFAWIFTLVGRRGYGEKQIFHTIALARWIDGGKWDVRHWVHPFATSGDTYRFAFPGTGHLYAALGDGDSVRGTVEQGREAAFKADIPLFSSRPFLHQGIMSGPQLTWEIAAFEPDAERAALRAATFKEPAGFDAEILFVVAQFGQKFYRLERGNSGWEIGKRSHVPLEEAFGSDQNWSYMMYDERPGQAAERLRESSLRLARIVTGDSNSPRPPLGRALQPGQVRLFTYASAPKAFPLQNADFQAGLALVLFVQDLQVRPPAAP